MNGMWIDIEGRGDDFKTDGYIKRALRDATHKIWEDWKGAKFAFKNIFNENIFWTFLLNI